MSHSIKKCLDIAQLIREKDQYQSGLEKVNSQLLQSLDTLEKTREKLVQSEKMAALGGLVAGVTHEVNTPVGIAIMAASFLKDKTSSIETLFALSNLKKSDLQSYFNTMEEVSHSILVNMERAASLINSLKQVAVDQVIEEKRIFNFKTYLQDLLISLKPSYRNRPEILMNVQCSEEINVNSYPGVFSQIFINLVMNSMIHGFKEISCGKIFFDVFSDQNMLLIRYGDTGMGMTEEELIRIFDPFFYYNKGAGWYRSWDVHCV